MTEHSEKKKMVMTKEDWKERIAWAERASELGDDSDG